MREPSMVFCMEILSPMFFRLSCAVVVILMSVATGHADPILLIETGVVTGASALNVGGNLYSVSFVDGTCVEVYSGCQTNLAFFDVGLASEASQALLDSVFTGTIDSLSVRGCPNAATFGCIAMTPYEPISTFTNIILVSTAFMRSNGSTGI